MDKRKLYEERNSLVTQAKEIQTTAQKENRDLSPEDEQHFDKIMARVDELDAQLEQANKREARAEWLEKADASLHEVQPRKASPVIETPEKGSDYQRAFRSWIINGVNGLNPAEFRALQSENNVYGGYLVPPQQFIEQFLKAVDDQTFIRRLATVHTVQGTGSLGVPTIENNPADADWTSELATGSEDTTMSFGKRELSPKPLAKRLTISNNLLRKVPAVESTVANRLAFKFGITEEKAFLTGSGANQPLGVFTASDQGISTGRDVTTGGTTASVTGDQIISCMYALKPGYWANASWIFHRDLISFIRKLRTTTSGDYLWKPGLDGTPDTLMTRPVYASEYAPNTLTSGLYVGILGDFKNGYWIADAMPFSMQRLVELYAESNRTGFIARMELDGMPVMEEAFVRVKLA